MVTDTTRGSLTSRRINSANASRTDSLTRSARRELILCDNCLAARNRGLDVKNLDFFLAQLGQLHGVDELHHLPQGRIHFASIRADPRES
jgi:hypothetical protein